MLIDEHGSMLGHTAKVLEGISVREEENAVKALTPPQDIKVA